MSPSSNKKTVLIIDDQPKNLQLAAYVLSPYYELVLVNNGAKGIKMAIEKMPDLILLDIMMPEMSGYEVCSTIKSNPLIDSIPIIFLTAKVAEEDLINAFEVGGVDYVTKPFRAKELLLRVKTQITLRDSLQKIKRYNDNLKALNENKDNLFSAVAHDLKGSSNQIASLIDIILDNLTSTLDGSEIKKPLALLKDSTYRNKELVTDLLDWSKNRFNSDETVQDEFKVSDIVNKVVDQLKPQIQEKKISIINEVDPDKILNTDKGAIGFVCRNILANAIKFTHENGKIKFSNFQTDMYNVIAVADDGVGMKQDTIDNLFSKTTSASLDGTLGEKGTGIGIKLCMDFIKKLGGHLKIDSKIGKGTTIQLWIPNLQNPKERESDNFSTAAFN